MTNDLKKVAEEIKGAETIGLMTHVNGDGDAFGSLLALRNILESLGKKVITFSNEPLPKYLDYLKKELSYKPKKRFVKVDLLIGLDLPDPKRFTVVKIFETAQKKGIKTVVIDHHTDGNLHKLVNTSWQKTEISSTAEMIFWLAEELGCKLDKITAQLLLWGLETDTYFLENKNVFKSTHQVQKALWGRGATTEEIKREVKKSSASQNEILMAHVLDRMQNNSGIYATYITAKDKKKAKIDDAVSSTIVSYLDYKYKPKLAIAVEQRSKKQIKVSMRSNYSDIDVSEIAKRYGGGGHVKAAGFEKAGNAEKDFEVILREISQMIK